MSEQDNRVIRNAARTVCDLCLDCFYSEIRDKAQACQGGALAALNALYTAHPAAVNELQIQCNACFQSTPRQRILARSEFLASLAASG